MYKTYKHTKISKRINNTYLKVIQSLVLFVPSVCLLKGGILDLARYAYSAKTRNKGERNERVTQ